MSDLNQVALHGRLTRSAELKYLNNESHTAITEFSIANNKSRKADDGSWTSDVSYFDCHIWGKYGEAIQKNLTKGRPVNITGRLKQDRWTRDGKSYSKITVEVSEVDFLPTGKTNDQNNAPAENQMPPSTSNEDFPEEVPF